MSNITKKQQDTLSEKLRQRRDELIKMIRAGTADAGRDNVRLMGGEVSNPEDQSMALQLADLNLTEMANEAQELRAIDHTFERMKAGTYGRCSECGSSIPYARLLAYPIAERCMECQTRHEHPSGGRDTTPSL